jgi:hypothetical protein
LIVVLARERLHGERTGPVRIDDHGRAEAILPHQRAKPRHERRHLLWRRLRARVQRVLHNPARRRIDDDGDAIDGGRRRMRFEIEQHERPERPHVTHRRRQLQSPRVDLAGDEAQLDVQDSHAAIPALEARQQRFEQARQHER